MTLLLILLLFAVVFVVGDIMLEDHVILSTVFSIVALIVLLAIVFGPFFFDPNELEDGQLMGIK